MSCYSLKDTINGFFSGCTATKDECDRAAAESTGQAVEPVRLQGAFGYTVAAGKLLVQFRVPESLLDTKTLDLARKIHGDVVPTCFNKGVIGPSPSLTIIFANSWVNRLTKSSYSSEHSLADLQDKLYVLSRHLPSRFTGVISKIREELPTNFVPTYLLALTHADLWEMNIIVDPKVGGVTGVVDWAEAKFLPIGISLWGLQNMLGIMNSRSWNYHENSDRLERLFWDTFNGIAGMISSDDKRAMKTAERAGLVLRYGYTWEDGIFERPVTEQDSLIRYLDAFLHRLEPWRTDD
ncbi:hypothetical protein N7492_004386 [Penicillium capsulatum]|uniref:Aminoglycoside phosphotransferase domain-containing protein n=1 Tax=Penicillium capsulatum TaxID=69766 RepID=A0A9W9I9W6_9EURO|nr:hypothetical protein N7492_004386 [Penicillium capsulatum]KAJ6136493.1 hypothetical protein N7512_001653 [Penicillium capsulatum]